MTESEQLRSEILSSCQTFLSVDDCMRLSAVLDSKLYGLTIAKAATVLSNFCEEQRGCQNCIFREFGADAWKCHINTFYLQGVLSNITAKKKHNGRIG